MTKHTKIRCNGLVMIICMMVAVQCKKAASPEADMKSGTGGEENTTNDITTWTPWIAISNTADKTIEIYRYNHTTWDATTREWSFKPTTALGYSSGAVSAMGVGVGDMRLHYVSGFSGKAESAFAIQGGRYLAIGAYIPSGSYVKGQKLWEYTFPSSQDPNNHAVELLPDGNLVVAGFGDGTASSTYGNWVRIYNTADATGASYAQVNIQGPHALLLDTIYHRLWVGAEINIGGVRHQGLFAYIIGGTRTSPTLTEDVSLRAVLPFGHPSSILADANRLMYPHDLTAEYDNDDVLIYGDHTGVYRFNKQTKAFTPTPGASHLYTGSQVRLKSASKMQGGYYVTTHAYNPTVHEYHTNKVDFFDASTGAIAFSRYVPGYTIYRARVWTHVYQ